MPEFLKNWLLSLSREQLMEISAWADSNQDVSEEISDMLKENNWEWSPRKGWVYAI